MLLGLILTVSDWEYASRNEVSK